MNGTKDNTDRATRDLERAKETFNRVLGLALQDGWPALFHDTEGRRALHELIAGLQQGLKSTLPTQVVGPSSKQGDAAIEQWIATTTGLTPAPASTGMQVDLEVQQMILLVEWKLDQLEENHDLRGKWFAHLKDTPREVVVECIRNWLMALYLLEEHLQTFQLVPVRVLELVAEAQSAIRALTSQDEEQQRTFQVLLFLLKEQGVRLTHFMSLKSLATPTHHADLYRRLMACWAAPQDTTKGGEKPQQRGEQEDRWEAHQEVQQARKLLLGQRLLLVGGDPRPEVIAALEDALGCQVVWFSTRPTSNFSEIRDQVERAEGEVVLLLIRWVRHASRHLREVKNKILVRVPGGYGLGGIAYQINHQASRRLQEKAEMAQGGKADVFFSGPDGHGLKP